MDTAGRPDNVLVGIEPSERGRLAKIVEEKAEATDGIALDITGYVGSMMHFYAHGRGGEYGKKVPQGLRRHPASGRTMPATTG